MLNVYNNLKTVLNQCNYTKKSIVNSNYDNIILENIKFMKTLIKVVNLMIVYLINVILI